MPGRRTQPRRFSYEPRFYNPEKDEKIKYRMRIGSRSRRPRRSGSVITLLILLGFAIYIYSLTH